MDERRIREDFEQLVLAVDMSERGLPIEVHRGGGPLAIGSSPEERGDLGLEVAAGVRGSARADGPNGDRSLTAGHSGLSLWQRAGDDSGRDVSPSDVISDSDALTLASEKPVASKGLDASSRFVSSSVNNSGEATGTPDPRRPGYASPPRPGGGADRLSR